MKNQDLTSLSNYSAAEIKNLLQTADSFSKAPKNLWPKTGINQVVCLVFFEASTRTRCSFELAAKNLGADVLNVEVSYSSLSKGESPEDMIKNLEAMGLRIFVIRHSDDHFCETLRQQLLPESIIINAGTGVSDHPTQALLDMATIQQHFSASSQSFEHLKIAIIGDVKRSRVARSDFQALKVLGCKNIHIIAPSEFISKDWQESGCSIYSSMQEGLQDVDVIIMLRIQMERLEKSIKLDSSTYTEKYQLTPKCLAWAKSSAIVMHPGPINRGVEIASDVADGAQSVILKQVALGVFIRMAVLEKALSVFAS
jgi:aspartate carbamoyltransferase catalytic subunit